MIICNAWMDIGQDLITGAEQKGGSYWNRISRYFLDRIGLDPQSPLDRTEFSHQKRRGLIQSEVNKFCSAYDHVLFWPVSGTGSKDLVYFRAHFI